MFYILRLLPLVFSASAFCVVYDDVGRVTVHLAEMNSQTDTGYFGGSDVCDPCAQLPVSILPISEESSVTQQVCVGQGPSCHVAVPPQPFEEAPEDEWEHLMYQALSEEANHPSAVSYRQNTGALAICGDILCERGGHNEVYSVQDGSCPSDYDVREVSLVQLPALTPPSSGAEPVIQQFCVHQDTPHHVSALSQILSGSDSNSFVEQEPHAFRDVDNAGLPERCEGVLYGMGCHDGAQGLGGDVLQGPTAEYYDVFPDIITQNFEDAGEEPTAKRPRLDEDGASPTAEQWYEEESLEQVSQSADCDAHNVALPLTVQRVGSDTVLSETQQNVLSYLQGCNEMPCSEDQVLQAVYAGKYDTLLEDVVALIHNGYNIIYDQKHYRLIAGSWVSGQTVLQCRKIFNDLLNNKIFKKLTLAEKTYQLYEYGCSNIPLGVVALFEIFDHQKHRVKKCRAIADKKLEDLIALRGYILSSGEILNACAYKSLFPQMQKINNADIASIQESLTLYAQGREFLANAVVQCKDADVVLKCLQDHHGQACSEDTFKLLMFYYRYDHAREYLYKAIAVLRSQGKNIVYDASNKTFTLKNGLRVKKRGPYKKVLWSMLSVAWECRESVPGLFRELSDRGYDPLFDVVEDIVLIKRFCRTYNPADVQLRLCHAKKKKVWDIICAEGDVQGALHYRSHPDGGVVVTEWELEKIRSLWCLYQEIMYDHNYDDAKALQSFLKDNAEGVGLQDVQKLMVIPTRTSLWKRLSSLMRSGYAGNVSVKDGVVYWDRYGQSVPRKEEGLLERVCAIPEGQDVYEATIAMHKEGYLSVGPWDVQRLLDVLVVTGRRHSGALDPEAHKLWETMQQGCEDLLCPCAEVNMTIKRLTWLKDIGVLDSIKNKQFVRFEKILTKEFWICDEEYISESLADQRVKGRRLTLQRCAGAGGSYPQSHVVKVSGTFRMPEVPKSPG